MRDQLVTETIDARILRLIGLEEAFDLDYDTYLILLKEAQVKGKNTLPAEEQAILANERKRIRGKVGRFKTKAINVNNITSVGRIGQKLLPTARGVGYAPIVKSLESISKTVESISDNLSDQSKDDTKEAEENRKDEENKRRRKREESLEASAKKVVSAAKKLFAPVRGILDSIYNYLFYTFLGRGINESLNWLANPENKNKVAALGQFVKDFWPALLGTAVAFFTPLGNFIRTVLGEIAKLAFRFPLVAAAAGVTALGELGAAKMREVTGKEYRLTGYEGTVPGVAPGRVPEVNSKKKSAQEVKENQEAPYGRNPDGSPRLFPKLFESGGFIDKNTGLKISGAGPDTQLTALQPGEVVMNRAAVRAIGAGNLLNLNRMFGGPNANKPKFANNIQLAQNGGMVGQLMNWWNKGRDVRVPNENQAKFGGIKQYFMKNPDPTTLLGDDAKQITRSDKAFKSGSTGYRGWNPFKAFTPNMVKTGPTPAIRQAVERPLRSFATTIPTMGRSASRSFRTFTTAAVKSNIRLAVMPVVGDMLSPKPVGGDLQSAIQRGDYKGPMPTPPSRSKTNMITLPPVVQNASMPTLRAGGSEVPSFSAVAPGNRRMENAQIYGIVP
jgi:hypothetical protein